MPAATCGAFRDHGRARFQLVIRVAVTLPAVIADAGEFLADAAALDAAGADAIFVGGGSADPAVVLGAIAAVTRRVRLGSEGGDQALTQRSIETLRAMSRGRVAAAAADGERWVKVGVPPDRASWAALLHEHEAAGATGIVVPWDPRLIDLLRNPEPDDRSDLLMSTG